MPETLVGPEATAYQQLRRQIQQAEVGNRLRENLFNARHNLDKIGFSVPDSMREFAAAIGWPEKAVTEPARRIRPGKFTAPSSPTLQDEVNGLFDTPYARLTERMAIDASLRLGPAFMFVTPGDTWAGEPDVVFSARSAREASALVDRRTLRTTAALELVDETTDLLYLPGQTLVVRRGRNTEVVQRLRGLPGRVPCVPYVWGRALDRLHGRSRITRPIIDLSGMAVRTLLRGEVTAEHFSNPQRALLGARKEAFTDKDGRVRSGFEIATGSVWGIPEFYDEETGEWRRPALEQLASASQQPHAEHFKMVAQQMASESSIPVNQLGLLLDNPPSAESIRVLESGLVGLVSSELPNYADARRETARLAMLTRYGDPTGALDRDMDRVRASFLNPGTVTPAAAADLAQKFTATHPELAGSDVVMELWGFDESQLERLQDEAAKVRGRNRLDQVLARRAGVGQPPTAAALTGPTTEG